MATKRSISPSNSPPLQKASRAEGKPSRELLCNLPPTCNRGQGTILLGTRELETHYAKYHAHVCAVPDCECVFPDSRLLELHFTERHDPLAKVKQERGEKIFACHLASCGQHFRNPKNRRLHLIQAHGYPKEYFFAITNKGIGGLLRKWGDGASLMRGTWKARDTAPTAAADSDSDIEDDKEQDNMDDDDEVLPTLRNGVSAPTQARASKNGHASTTASTRSGTNGSSATGRNGLSPADGTSSTSSAAVDDLAGTMSTLSLVPSSVRFGRGAKSSGHIGRHSHSSQTDPPISPSSTDARRDTAQSQSATDPMKEDSSNAPHAQAETMDQDANPYFRGRGLARARGSRGRGGFPRGGYGVPRGVQRGMMYRGGRGRGAAMNVG